MSRTPLCGLLGIDLPIIMAPFGPKDQNDSLCVIAGRNSPLIPTIQGGSFARLPPAPTTLCYLRLSATTVMGLLSVATRWLGDQGREEPPFNEISASVLTIHDVLP